MELHELHGAFQYIFRACTASLREIFCNVNAAGTRTLLLQHIESWVSAVVSDQLVQHIRAN